MAIVTNSTTLILISYIYYNDKKKKYIFFNMFFMLGVLFNCETQKKYIEACKFANSIDNIKLFLRLSFLLTKKLCYDCEKIFCKEVQSWKAEQK